MHVLPLLAALGLALAAALPQPPRPRPENDAAEGAVPSASELFLTHCASCHGATGDGKGTTELDRPARSFRDGGFSYGNTPEALFRTITNGIPGTPMPGFDTALDERQRRLLADYVVSLGPPQTEVDPERSKLHVQHRAVFVRGGLPPLLDGAPSFPRGLLLGTTRGMTFQLRADDVRLIGVRQGDFVNRADWTGRGGQPLEPLGKLVYALGAGDPAAEFRWKPAGGEAVDVSVKLLGTWGDLPGRPRIQTRPGGVDREVPGPTTQFFQAVTTPFASGFRRRVLLTHDRTPGMLEARLCAPMAEPLEHRLERTPRADRLRGRPARGRNRPGRAPSRCRGGELEPRWPRDRRAAVG